MTQQADQALCLGVSARGEHHVKPHVLPALDATNERGQRARFPAAHPRRLDRLAQLGQIPRRQRGDIGWRRFEGLEPRGTHGIAGHSRTVEQQRWARREELGERVFRFEEGFDGKVRLPRLVGFVNLSSFESISRRRYSHVIQVT